MPGALLSALGLADDAAVVALEGDGDVSRRAVAVLGQDEVGLASARRLALVGIFAVRQLHHVDILLDRVVPRGAVGRFVCDGRDPGVRGNLCANSAHNLKARVQEDMRLEQHGLKWSEPLHPNSFIMFPDSERIVSWRDPEKLRAEYDRFAPGDFDAHHATLAEMEDLGRVLDVSFFEAPPTFAELASTPMTNQQQSLPPRDVRQR